MTPLAGPLGYAAMRRAWCRHALWALVRRWGVYTVVVVVLVGAGTNGGLGIAAALAAALVLPLFHAVAQSAALGLLAVVLQALAGAGVVWALRPLLLPRRWLEAERALPVDPVERQRSDAQMVALALLPLYALYVGGAVSVVSADPPWLQAHEAAAPGALVVSALGSLALGMAVLRGRRRPPRYRFAAPATAVRSGARHWPLVLLVLPLWRGPARRLGAVLAVGAALLCLPVAGLAAWPQGGGWWLAALAAAALVLATRAAALVREELLPLLDETLMLPLPQPLARRGAALLPALPLLPAYAGLLLTLPPARPAVLVVFVLGSLGAALLQARWSPADAETQGARWLLLLALLLALASEVLR